MSSRYCGIERRGVKPHGRKAFGQASFGRAMVDFEVGQLEINLTEKANELGQDIETCSVKFTFKHNF
jgi:hypothetical protein